MIDKINKFLSDTHKHTKKVRYFLDVFIIDLIKRGQIHDNSKFEEPELSLFAEHHGEFKDLVYGSNEYKKLIEKIKTAVNYHHSKNKHHPEYWENGIDDMTLVDLIEMICDWRAAIEKNKDGDIFRSLEINSVKHNISPQLKKILENTIKEYFKDK